MSTKPELDAGPEVMRYLGDGYVGSRSRDLPTVREAIDNRAPSRRYLKPIFGCLRRNRRGVFAAAVTRYLKPVYAAEPVGIEEFSRRQTLGTRPRKVTRELPGGVAGSDATSAGYLHMQSQDPRSPMASRPGAQGPPAARAPEAARQQCRSSTRKLVTESNEGRVGT